MKFRYNTYDQASKFDDKNCFDVDTKSYKLALDSLATIDPGDLTTEQTATIANNILKIVTTTQVRRPKTLMKHLNILQNCMKKPSDSMILLADPEASVRPEPGKLQFFRILSHIESCHMEDITLECAHALARVTRHIVG